VGDVAADYLGLETRANARVSITTITTAPSLMSPKTPTSTKVLLGMACNFATLTTTGTLILLGTGDPDLSTLIPNRMFRMLRGSIFRMSTTAGGFGHLQKGHGIAFADLEQRRDQDVFANMGGAYTGDVYRKALFENPGNRNHWLKVKLVA